MKRPRLGTQSQGCCVILKYLTEEPKLAVQVGWLCHLTQTRGNLTEEEASMSALWQQHPWAGVVFGHLNTS